MKRWNNISLSITTCMILSTNLYSNEIQSMDSITVTAQKTEQNILEVPLSISVFDEESLKERSISNLADIASFTPSLLLFDAGATGLTIPTIRGLSGDIVSFSSPVSLYIDGVPTMTSFGFENTLLDIERIEVLKGPQGTLYGKNSEAGVINIITKKPNNNLKGKVYSKIGTDGKLEYGGNISGAIIKNKLYAGIAYKHDEKDGFITNTNTGKEEDTKEGDFGKLNLRYTPSDNLDISLVSSHSKRDDGSLSWANAGQSEDIKTSSNLIGYSKPEEDTHSLSVDYVMNKDTKFSSVTTMRNYSEDAALDLDGTANTLLHNKRDYDFDTYTQEFRLENKINDTKILTGLYMDKEDYDIDYTKYTAYTPLGYSTYSKLGSNTYSMFTNMDTPLNENFSITAGLRYDKEEKDITQDSSSISEEKDFSSISPKLSLIYNADVSTSYLTIAKGYKSGGFNAFVSTGSSFDEEELISYEIGYKNSFFEDRLILSTALYYMDIDNMQVQLTDSSSNPYISNAAKATSKGVELELQAFLSDDFTFFTSFGLNDTKFDHYTVSGTDYSGNYNTFAPKYNFNLALQYKSDRGYFARADLNGYGKTYFDSANKYYQEAYELVNAKIGYETNSYDIYIYGNNIFDKEHHATNAYRFGLTTVYYDDSEFGVELAYKF